MDRKDRVFLTIAVISVSLAAIAVGLRIRQEFFRPRPAVTTSLPVPIADWKEYASVGHRMGADSPQVTITIFGDFECPFCAKFATEALAPVRSKYSNTVSVVFRHWPLKMHKFAYPSARAAECAGEQGRFEAMHDLLYRKQDSLGLKSFLDFARESGVEDVNAFSLCDAKTEKIDNVERDIVAAKKLGGKGTPLILVNEMMLPGAPSPEALDSIVGAAISKSQNLKP